jgi:hypothetical protein
LDSTELLRKLIGLSQSLCLRKFSHISETVSVVLAPPEPNSREQEKKGGLSNGTENQGALAD